VGMVVCIMLECPVRMMVAVLAVLSLMPVFMRLRSTPVLMLVFVYMLMFMCVLMRVFVHVRHISMPVLVRMDVNVGVFVFMCVFMGSFHR